MIVSHNTNQATAYSPFLPACIEDRGPDPDRPGNHLFRLHLNPSVQHTTTTDLNEGLVNPGTDDDITQTTTVQYLPPDQASLVLCLRHDDTYLILPPDTDTVTPSETDIHDSDPAEPRDSEME